MDHSNATLPIVLDKPFKDERTSIRLLKPIGLRMIEGTTQIECTLAQFKHSTAPVYNAVAYERTAPDTQVKPSVVIDGTFHRVSQTIHDYLLRMMTGGALFDHRLRQKWLWIYELCFNAQDDGGREPDVSLIYRNASMVIIWLGTQSARDCRLAHIRRDGYDSSTCKGNLYLHCSCSTYWQDSHIEQHILPAGDLYFLLDHDLHPWWMVVDGVRPAPMASASPNGRIATILQLDRLRKSLPSR